MDGFDIAYQQLSMLSKIFLHKTKVKVTRVQKSNRKINFCLPALYIAMLSSMHILLILRRITK
jgi:hypothetical protein